MIVVLEKRRVVLMDKFSNVLLDSVGNEVVEKTSDKLINDAQIESEISENMLKSFYNGKDPMYYRYIRKQEFIVNELLKEKEELIKKINTLENDIKKPRRVGDVYVSKGDGPYCVGCYDMKGNKNKLILDLDNTPKQVNYFFTPFLGYFLFLIIDFIRFDYITSLIDNHFFIFYLTIPLALFVFITTYTVILNIKNKERKKMKCPICMNVYIVNTKLVECERKKYLRKRSKKLESERYIESHKIFKNDLNKLVNIGENSNEKKNDFTEAKNTIQEMTNLAKKIQKESNRITR